MKKAFVMMLCTIALFGAEKSLKELKEENEILQMQLKNQKLRKELEEGAKSDEEKKAEKVAETKEILKEALKAPSKDEKRNGTFGGIGFGGVAMSFSNELGKKSNEGYLIDFQGGYMTMWNRLFGLQYYTNTNLGLVNVGNGSSSGNWKAVNFGLLVNTDAIFNAYNGDMFGIGFLVGLGLGVKIDTIGFEDKSSTFFAFDARANLGIRLIFGSRFAIDFMAQFPFLTQEGLGGYKYREIATYTVRLVGGRF